MLCEGRLWDIAAEGAAVLDKAECHMNEGYLSSFCLYGEFKCIRYIYQLLEHDICVFLSIFLNTTRACYK